MALNDLLTNVPTAQTPAPVETPPANEPAAAPVEQDEPEFEVSDDGTITYADGYRIDPDGRHFDADGTEIPDGEGTPPGDPASPVAATPTAAAPTPAEPSAPVPQAPPVTVIQPQAGQQPVYTYQNCYRPEQVQEIQQLMLSGDPVDLMKANQIIHQQMKAVEQYAKAQFHSQVNALEREAPDLVQRFRNEIAMAGETLAVEQLQRPGVVNEIAAALVARDLAADPKRMQDLLLGRAVVSQPAPAVPAVPVEKPAAPVIPPAQRMPQPRGVRRQVPTRNGSGQFAGNKSGLKLIMELNPTMSEEEARSYAEGISNAEKRRDS